VGPDNRDFLRFGMTTSVTHVHKTNNAPVFYMPLGLNDINNRYINSKYRLLPGDKMEQADRKVKVKLLR
jgi:hypothetical protein